ncbi:MAG: triphosphatase [Alphaproteobacteria bacterium]|jgi:triphosphatase
MEIELKLISNQDALSLFETKVLPGLLKQDIQIEQNHAHLYNEYFDTPDEFFGKRKMACRVRSRNQKYEQTVKTKGQAQGGLHQRPEYNVDLDSARPDLSKFDPQIWGEPFDVKAVNDQLEGLFSTHFERTTFEISTKEYALELVFDLGEVKRAQDTLPICEIELELVRGEPTALFDIAQQLVTYLPCRLSNVTKAARGYQLLHGRIPEIMYLPQFLPLNVNDTSEQAFCKTVQVALSHWQHHQQVYSQNSNRKALNEIYESILLLLQGLALYLPVLQCKELLNLHKQLVKLAQAWSWQEQLESIHQLRSKKGPFSRRIPRNQNLMNYLMGRREGLLNAHKPDVLNMSLLSTSVQLAASRVLVDKPWRSQNDENDTKVIKHANGWLSQTWQTVHQSLPKNASMDDKQYLALEVLLRQSLINGFLLADLFVDSRGQFRAPWLDLATGVKELKCLRLLHEALNDIDIEGKADFSNWIEEKTHSVIHVMEQTRVVAMDADAYW